MCGSKLKFYKLTFFLFHVKCHVESDNMYIAHMTGTNTPWYLCGSSMHNSIRNHLSLAICTALLFCICLHHFSALARRHKAPH